MIKIVKKKTMTFKELEDKQMFIFPTDLHLLARKVPEFFVENIRYNTVKLVYTAQHVYVLTYAYYNPEVEVIPVKVSNIQIEIEEM